MTELLVPGENVLGIRVHQWSAASYLEDQDQWWLPGIFRPVELLARPAGALDDVRVRADRDPADGSGRLDVQVDGAFPVVVRVPELGSTRPGRPRPTSRPSRSRGRRLERRAAAPLRRVRVVARGDREPADRLPHGAHRRRRAARRRRRLTFRGVNRHESHPERGRVFDEAEARADLELMKRSGVNAIRTSHYPPHPRLIDIADELGLWVVLECDLETHGFWTSSGGTTRPTTRAGATPTATASRAPSAATATTRRS
ncbi:Beta-galactosidase [Clavibacter michiganensis subsp. michiganensis]|uniref:beta-galactosidase n=1 Tax=Clavibacter michiganensis subsp. michiganensis TaxID=33013 RepID=A0A251XPE3_CLAMM|nr:Beta-galactosidase [Clavibacter michiganensis subsp. michiganensis]OUE04928.1 Beta-galactosidase [Clavibacter michiganensis subsp. michiganensis]